MSLIEPQTVYFIVPPLVTYMDQSDVTSTSTASMSTLQAITESSTSTSHSSTSITHIIITSIDPFISISISPSVTFSNSLPTFPSSVDIDFISSGPSTPTSNSVSSSTSSERTESISSGPFTPTSSSLSSSTSSECTEFIFCGPFTPASSGLSSPTSSERTDVISSGPSTPTSNSISSSTSSERTESISSGPFTPTSSGLSLSTSSKCTESISCGPSTPTSSGLSSSTSSGPSTETLIICISLFCSLAFLSSIFFFLWWNRKLRSSWCIRNRAAKIAPFRLLTDKPSEDDAQTFVQEPDVWIRKHLNNAVILEHESNEQPATSPSDCDSLLSWSMTLHSSEGLCESNSSQENIILDKNNRSMRARDGERGEKMFATFHWYDLQRRQRQPTQMTWNDPRTVWESSTHVPDSASVNSDIYLLEGDLEVA